VVVDLLAGALPRQGRVTAVVLSDTDCTPDARGLSHCTNELLLADGERISVRDNHDMRRYPCLTPGETVEVHAVGP
jgi:hypothetical protein